MPVPIIHGHRRSSLSMISFRQDWRFCLRPRGLTVSWLTVSSVQMQATSLRETNIPVPTMKLLLNPSRAMVSADLSSSLEGFRVLTLETFSPVLSHIISQLRPGADLSRVTLPTFILEPRSMLERITKSVSLWNVSHNWTPYADGHWGNLASWHTRRHYYTCPTLTTLCNDSFRW